jgi:hypothetical protein
VPASADCLLLPRQENQKPHWNNPLGPFGSLCEIASFVEHRILLFAEVKRDLAILENRT